MNGWVSIKNFGPGIFSWASGMTSAKAELAKANGKISRGNLKLKASIQPGKSPASGMDGFLIVIEATDGWNGLPPRKPRVSAKERFRPFTHLNDDI